MAIKTEARDVAGFSEVAVRGFGEATLVQGDQEGLTVEADESIIGRIRSEVRDTQLVLGLDLTWWESLTWWLAWLFMPNRQVHYTVMLREFTGASIAGSGKIISQSLHAGQCSFKISGSGKIVVDRLIAESVETRISGSGDVTMAGSAHRQDVHISGSGNVKTSELETAETDIHIGGSGRASVHATQSLSVSIGGSGAVFYRGQPQVSQHIAGSGRVGMAN